MNSELFKLDTPKDFAKKYRKTQSSATDMFSDDELAPYLKQLETNGYVIIENLLSSSEIQAVRQAVQPLLDNVGRNSFEGLSTQRVYSVVSKTLGCNPLAAHPLVLALLDKLLLPGYLLSQLQIINILAEEAQQSLHYDDSFYPFSRPRNPLGLATVWALDEFTEDNGATAVIPGSHKWGDETPLAQNDPRQIACTMPAGSVVLFLGTLWHGGGANTSGDARLAITAQYCEPYLRTQENYSLSVSAQRVAQVSEDMKRMLGYSIYGPFMGMVDGKHPKRLLEAFRD